MYTTQLSPFPRDRAAVEPRAQEVLDFKQLQKELVEVKPILAKTKDTTANR